MIKSGEVIGRYFLRLHGTIALIIGITLSIMALNGYYNAEGFLSTLSSNSIGFIGMIQSYGFMVCFGLLIWIGSFHIDKSIWHLTEAFAHIVPSLGNIIFGIWLKKKT